MTTEVKTICDECGRVKGETNRWWQIARHDDHPVIAIAHAGTFKLLGNKVDLCGEKCVIACVQKFLAEPNSGREE